MSNNEYMYGITNDLRLVRFYLCKCEHCKERGMYECIIDYVNGDWYGSIRIDKLNEHLIYATKNKNKVVDMFFKLYKNK